VRVHCAFPAGISELSRIVFEQTRAAFSGGTPPWSLQHAISDNDRLDFHEIEAPRGWRSVPVVCPRDYLPLAARIGDVIKSDRYDQNDRGRTCATGHYRFTCIARGDLLTAANTIRGLIPRRVPSAGRVRISAGRGVEARASRSREFRESCPPVRAELARRAPLTYFPLLGSNRLIRFTRDPRDYARGSKGGEKIFIITKTTLDPAETNFALQFCYRVKKLRGPRIILFPSMEDYNSSI